MREIQRFHMDTRGWSDIAYSFLVDDDGTVFEGRGAGVAGGHTQGHNTISHAICAMGNYEAQIPGELLLSAIRRLGAAGRDRGWWPGRFTGGHRDASGASTACPGSNLYAQLSTLTFPTGPVPVPVPIPEVPDMAGRSGVIRYQGVAHVFTVAADGRLVHHFDTPAGPAKDYPAAGWDPEAGVTVSGDFGPALPIVVFGQAKGNPDVTTRAQWNPAAGRWEADARSA
jgi:hypothetical protein